MSHETKDFGRLYFQLLDYPEGAEVPFTETAETQEIEEPYRVGRGRTVRIAPRRALVVGLWSRTGTDEKEALERAVAWRDMDVDVDDLLEWQRPLPEAEMIPDAFDFAEHTGSPHLNNIDAEREQRHALGTQGNAEPERDHPEHAGAV